MSAGIACFLLEPAGRERRYLRRYSNNEHRPCPAMPGDFSYHTARAFLDEVEDEGEAISDSWPHDDPRWPDACPCGYRFAEDDHWQLFRSDVYRRADTGEETTLRDAPPGAMWYADWMTFYLGPDGRCLVVKLPGGHDWRVDSRASNCTMPEDNEHRCWVRHGTPPNVTADKNGNTCAAGAGSIAVPGWHGFLRDGFLVP